MSAFDDLHAIPPQLLAEGYLARAVHGAGLTLAVVEVEPRAGLPEHQHDNEQFGIVIEGSVIVRVKNETLTLTPGGIWRIPSGSPHTVTGGEAGAVVIDVFSSERRLEHARAAGVSAGSLAVGVDALRVERAGEHPSRGPVRKCRPSAARSRRASRRGGGWGD